ncbi:MAG: type IV pilin N-terminal domain-containing protein, partial [Candidatus Nanohaloarchaea archaeon]
MDERKGISPVIAAILLIGVAVFAVGGVFMFTQNRIGNLQSTEPAPRATVIIKGAFENIYLPYTPGSTCCSGEPGVVLLHKGGDTIQLENIKIQLT